MVKHYLSVQQFFSEIANISAALILHIVSAIPHKIIEPCQSFLAFLFTHSFCGLCCGCPAMGEFLIKCCTGVSRCTNLMRLLIDVSQVTRYNYSSSGIVQIVQTNFEVGVTVSNSIPNAYFIILEFKHL